MKSRHLFPLLLLALLALGATRAGAAEPAKPPKVPQPDATRPDPGAANQVTLRTQFFRIRGSISGDTSLTDDLWAGKPPKGETAKALTFFTVAKLKVAGHNFNADERGWQWDGEPLRIEAGELAGQGDNLILLANPTVHVETGVAAKINVSSGQDIQYFVPRGGRTYELKTLEQPTGISLKFPVERGKDGRPALKGLELTMRLVERREPLEGTTLNVGKPVVSVRAYAVEIHPKPGRDYGLLFFTNDGQGMLLLRLRLD